MIFLYRVIYIYYDRVSFENWMKFCPPLQVEKKINNISFQILEIQKFVFETKFPNFMKFCVQNNLIFRQNIDWNPAIGRTFKIMW